VLGQVKLSWVGVGLSANILGCVGFQKSDPTYFAAGEGYKTSEKNAPVERSDRREKLHGSKTRGLGQNMLESGSVMDLLVTPAED